MSLKLRQATPADIPIILQLVAELAAYEKAPEQALATPEQMRRAIFGDPSRDGRGAGIAECILGELDGKVEGLALFFMNFSSWTGRAGMYLEDLFVRPTARGRGLGKALLARVARIALDRGCPRFEWTVIDWNTPAIEFYKSLGAEPLDKWTVHRASGEELVRLGALDRD